MTGSSSDRPASSLVSGAAYLMLALFGVGQGMLGGFQYSRLAPAGAILFCAAIFVTCLAGGWAMQSIAGAFLPAVGWVLAAFILAEPKSNGSVIIANTNAGQWFLYGGTLSAAVASIVVFGLWMRTTRRP